MEPHISTLRKTPRDCERHFSMRFDPDASRKLNLLLSCERESTERSYKFHVSYDISFIFEKCATFITGRGRFRIEFGGCVLLTDLKTHRFNNMKQQRLLKIIKKHRYIFKNSEI